MGITTGIIGAIALGALIIGLVWWLRSLDRSRGTKETRPIGNDREGLSEAFKSSKSDESRRPR